MAVANACEESFCDTSRFLNERRWWGSSGLQHGVSSNNAQTSHVASKTLHFGRWCVCLARRPSLVATPFLPHSKLRRKAASVAIWAVCASCCRFSNGAYSSWVLFAKP